MAVVLLMQFLSEQFICRGEDADTTEIQMLSQPGDPGLPLPGHTTCTEEGYSSQQFPSIPFSPHAYLRPSSLKNCALLVCVFFAERGGWEDHILAGMYQMYV